MIAENYSSGMIQSGILVSIVNHENTSNALTLARGFGERAETMLIDSGSRLTDGEKEQFDVVLPNVYYSGLFNETKRIVSARADVDILLFICSDVLIQDPAFVVDRMAHVFSDPAVGGYTPSNTGSGHPFCQKQETSGLREIPFVDGFILGIRRSVLDRIPFVDLDVNPLGWGVDVYAGYVAASMRLRTVVDDLASVHHPPGSGYDRQRAFGEMLQWLAVHGDGSHRYFRLYRRLRRLSRFRLSRISKGRISPLEVRLFRLLARL